MPDFQAELAPPPVQPAAAAAAPRATRARRPSLSLVLPCHNEARNLEMLLPLLSARLPALADAWEIVLVDDGSRDDTAEVMSRWAANGTVRAVHLSRNFGKEAALTAGLAQACGEVVITMDADLQHPPALLDAMLAQWREGADVVYAVREHRRDEGPVKRLGTALFYGLLNGHSRFAVPPGAGDFRLMDRKVVKALLGMPERTRFMKGLYAWVGFDARPLPYSPPPRLHGRSSFNLRGLVSLSLDGITAFTTWPLRLATVLGLVMALGALVYGAALIVSYLESGHPVSGWTTIVVGMALLAGVQMVLLGVVGEYVGRIFEEVKRRPLYVVKDVEGRGLGDPS